MATRIRLMHWNKTEAQDYLDILKTAGYDVQYQEKFVPGLLRSFRESPPDAFLIDLGRLPSHGREIAIAIRQSRAIRQIPIVFCEGLEEKIEKVRMQLPDAAYCRRANLIATLRKVLAEPRREPITPVAMMGRYATRTTVQKLGITKGSTLLLIDPPRDWQKVLGSLPAGVTILDGSEHACPAVTLCFVHGLDGLRSTLSDVRGLAKSTKLWILWRKGGSARRGELTGEVVRESANELGLVDYKICSANEVWSGMLFAPPALRSK
jgi:CheY-like chemotaxis protein